MDITHKLLSLPTFLLLTILLAFFAAISLFITFFFHKYIRVKVMNAHNELTGYAFSVVAGFYALVLAFVVFQALDEFNGVQRDADIEGSLAKSLYRQIKYYPDTDTATTAALKREYIRYVNLVVNEEYPNMEKLQKSMPTVEAFGNVFEMIERLNPTDHNVQDKAAIMLNQLNELAKYRNLRNLAGDSEIPGIMWLALLLGWLITMIFASMINVENLRYHLTVNALMGAFAGLIFFLIVILDHPFTGSMKVEPTSYEQVIQMEANPGVKR
jgi:Ca2+/H+ antiporter